MKRILLVNSPNFGGVGESANIECFPSIGILSLATQIKKAFPKTDIQCVDGGIHGTKEILKIIDSFEPELVGVSVLTPTYKEGLKIAEYAKTNFNSIIVLGNDHAFFFPELILKNRRFIDFIIENDVAEIPFVQLIKYLNGENNIQNIPSLVYRNGINIARNQQQKYSLKDVLATEADIIDLKLIEDDLQIFAKNYNKKFKRFHNHRINPITVNNVRGCGHGNVRCTYCSIYDLSLNAGNPDFFWKIVAKYVDFGINFFFEVCDSFGSFRTYIDKLVETMPFNPKNEGIEFMVYSRAQDIAYNPKLVEQFKKLNIVRANVGFDSGDKNMLISQRKGNKINRELETNSKAVNVLYEAGISIHASFIAGALGETHKTLENTAKYIDALIDKGDFATIEFSKHVPLPNSPTWDLLINKFDSEFYGNGKIGEELQKYNINIGANIKEMLEKKYSNTDLLDINELAHDWIKFFTHINNEEAEKVLEKINKNIESHHINIGSNMGV